MWTSYSYLCIACACRICIWSVGSQYAQHLTNECGVRAACNSITHRSWMHAISVSLKLGLYRPRHVHPLSTSNKSMYMCILDFHVQNSRIHKKVSMIVFKLYMQNVWPLLACCKVNQDELWLIEFAVFILWSANNLKIDEGEINDCSRCTTGMHNKRSIELCSHCLWQMTTSNEKSV